MLEDAQRWFSCRQEVSGLTLRMFCFPFGGGGASIFRSWQQGLPPRVEVCPVQLPGRENRFREPPIKRLPQMISTLSDVFRPYLDRPFVLFGHSIGALIAFELARQLRRTGLRSPEWLFVSGHPSPDLPRRRPSVSNLAKPEFIEAMREHFEVSPALLGDADMMEFVFPALRADYELVETYLYHEEPPFSFPISVFGGSHDPETTGDEVAAWRRHTTGVFRTRIIDGNHMFINTARQDLISEVAKDLVRMPLLQP